MKFGLLPNTIGVYFRVYLQNILVGLLYVLEEEFTVLSGFLRLWHEKHAFGFCCDSFI